MEDYFKVPTYMANDGTAALGGGLSKASNFILEALKKEVYKRVFTREVKYGDIVLAQLGNDAEIIGAAFLDGNL